MKTRVVTISPDATLGEAVDLMDIYQVNALPVVNHEGYLIGLLSERNLLSILSSRSGEVQYREKDRISGISMRSVSECFSKPPVEVEEETDICEILRLMIEHHLTCLPVLTEEGKFAGFVNCVDVVQALLDSQSSEDARST